MLRLLLSSLLVLILALAPAGAQEYNIVQPYAKAAAGGVLPTMHRANCASSITNATTYNPAGFQSITATGVANGDSVVVYVIIPSEDAGSAHGVNSASVDGNAMTEAFDDNGPSDQGIAVYRTSGTITADGTFNVSVTFSEAMTSAAVCLWAFKNLNSATPVDIASDFENETGAPITLTLTTDPTEADGFVIAGAMNNATGSSASSWAVLTERQEVDTGEATFTTADGAATGASMAVTVTYPSNDRVTGVSVAVR